MYYMSKKTGMFLIICLEFALSFQLFAQHAREFNAVPATISGVSGVKITHYSGNDSEINIPNVLNGKKVIAIGAQAFMFKNLTSAVLPEGLLVIESQAFLGNNLSEIFIPRSVTTIDSSAFDNNKMINVYKNYTGENVAIDNIQIRHNTDIVSRVDVIPPESKAYNVAPGILEKDAAVKLYAFSSADENSTEMVDWQLSKPIGADSYAPVSSVTPTSAAPTSVVMPTSAMPAQRQGSVGVVPSMNVPKQAGVVYINGLPTLGGGMGSPGNTSVPAGSSSLPESEAKAAFAAAVRAQAAAGIRGSKPVQTITETITIQTMTTQTAPVQTMTTQSVQIMPAQTYRANPTAPVTSAPKTYTAIDTGAEAKSYGQTQAQPTGTFYVQSQGNGTGTVINYRTSYKDAIIPGVINGLTITRIGKGAFIDKRLESVSFSDCVAYIDDAAFSGNQITSLKFPDSVRFIGAQAFSGSQIRGVHIGSGVTIQSDSILNNFGDFYNINGKQAGSYSWADGRWEYIAPDGTRTISGEYVLPESTRANINAKR
jgi:hypothetical protein